MMGGDGHRLMRRGDAARGDEQHHKRREHKERGHDRHPRTT
jgi:hypothetical protein